MIYVLYLLYKCRKIMKKKENDEIESNLDTNEESIRTIESKLSESLCNQKYFIQLIKDNIKLYMSNN